MRTGSGAVGPQSSSLGGNSGAGVGTIESCWPQCWTYHMQEQSGISSQSKEHWIPFSKAEFQLHSVMYQGPRYCAGIMAAFLCSKSKFQQVSRFDWTVICFRLTGTDPAAHALPLIQRHRFCPSLGNLCLNSCWQPLEGWEQIEEFVSKKWNWIYRNDFWITGQVEIFEKLISDKSRILFLVLLIK